MNCELVILEDKNLLLGRVREFLRFLQERGVLLGVIVSIQSFGQLGSIVIVDS